MVVSYPNLTSQPPLNPLLPKEGKLRTTVIFEAECAENAEAKELVLRGSEKRQTRTAANLGELCGKKSPSITS